MNREEKTSKKKLKNILDEALQQQKRFLKSERENYSNYKNENHITKVNPEQEKSENIQTLSSTLHNLQEKEKFDLNVILDKKKPRFLKNKHSN